MDKFCLIFLYLLLPPVLFGQTPLSKQWDVRFGGNSLDILTVIQTGQNGKIFLGGYSWSDSSGDKSEPQFGSTSDYWIVCLDTLGNKLWDRTLGGLFGDQLSFIYLKNNNQILVGGSSFSDSTGTRTHFNRGQYDFWIQWIDSSGNVLWDKAYGGNNYDRLHAIEPTSDGGYVLAGYSSSDSSYEKTQPAWPSSGSNASYDYWILKIDSVGNKIWDKRFGGNGSDIATTIVETIDKGFIIGGISNSGISGDKTSASYDSVVGMGSLGDYWIVKTDSAGNKLWDKSFGGISRDLMIGIKKVNATGGYIMGGYSNSLPSGNKTALNKGGFDYWMVRIDESGNILWDKTYGGAGDDRVVVLYGQFFESGNLLVDTDGGFILGGASTSGISGDKSEANLGPMQSWYIKTDSNGNKIWDKTLLTTDSVGNGFFSILNSGCYVFGNHTKAGIGGIKTQNSWGFNDYWITLFCDTTEVTSVSEVVDPIPTIYAYPNPFTESVTIGMSNFQHQVLQVMIYDIAGRLVYNTRNQTSEFPLQINFDFSKGIYFLSVGSNHETYHSTIIRQ